MKETAKAYYESHRVSFAWLANHSSQILGQPVTLDVLKKWSQEDGGWNKKSISGLDKLKFLEQRTFERLEDAENISTKDFTALVSLYLQIQAKTPDIVTDAKPSLQTIIDVGAKLKQSGLD